jgi:hypothetical protein
MASTVQQGDKLAETTNGSLGGEFLERDFATTIICAYPWKRLAAFMRG